MGSLNKTGWVFVHALDDWYRIFGGLGRGQGAVLAGHCLGDGEGWAQWGEGLHLGLIVGGNGGDSSQW